MEFSPLTLAVLHLWKRQPETESKKYFNISGITWPSSGTTWACVHTLSDVPRFACVALSIFIEYRTSYVEPIWRTCDCSGFFHQITEDCGLCQSADCNFI